MVSMFGLLAVATPCRIRMASQKILLVMRRQKGTVAVAMSGGIDSSVAAMILKDQGYNCVGVFMRNWDSSDEIGEVACSIDRDREHMREVCHRLNIPAVDVDFVKDYWNEVFVPFIDTYRSGSETPNPDVMCNRQIKFLRFRDHVREKLGINTIATGHYARLRLASDENESDNLPRLLKGSDITKDQSYFLSMTQGSGFKDVLFPIGSHRKNEIRLMAAERLKGLAVLTKKESMGVCFIGKRSMPTFLSNYMKLTPGRFIDLDTGKILGRHEGKEALTIGQGAKIGGSKEKYFIVPSSSYTANKDDSMVGDVYVCMGSNHPSLFCTMLTVRADRMSWIAGRPPEGIRRQVSKLFSNNGNNLTNNDDKNTAIESRNSNNDNHIENIDGKYTTESSSSFGGSTFRCKYKARYLQPEGDCVVTVRLISEKNRNLSTTELNISGNSINEKMNHNSKEISDNDDNYNNNHNSVEAMCNDSINKNSQIDNNYGSTKSCNYNINDYELVVAFDVPQRAVTPGQILALYMGEECLGGGIISLE